jgi:hypothetical protein
MVMKENLPLNPFPYSHTHLKPMSQAAAADNGIYREMCHSRKLTPPFHMEGSENRQNIIAY